MIRIRARSAGQVSLILAAIGLLALASPLIAQQGEGMPSPGGATGQPQSVEPGTFANQALGYSIMIPEGFTGMSMPDPANLLMVSELAFAGGAGNRQFMVGFSSAEQSTDPVPDFASGDLEEIRRTLQSSNRGPGPQTQLSIEETTREQIGGRRGVRLRFTTSAPGSDETIRGVMYAVNHRDGALVVQYFAEGPGGEIDSFAEQNIATLSLQ